MVRDYHINVLYSDEDEATSPISLISRVVPRSVRRPRKR